MELNRLIEEVQKDLLKDLEVKFPNKIWRLYILDEENDCCKLIIYTTIKNNKRNKLVILDSIKKYLEVKYSLSKNSVIAEKDEEGYVAIIYNFGINKLKDWY